MKVWFKIQSFNRPFFKQTIIHNCDDILKYIRYLYSTSSQTNISSTSPLQSTANKSKALLSLQPSSKNTTSQTTSVQASSIQTDDMVSVKDEESNDVKVYMKTLYPSSNLQSILFPKKVKAGSQKAILEPEFIEDLLTKSKNRIFSESKNIPSHLFINQPNIISAVLQASKQKEGEKSSSERRSKILPVNQKIYIELLNQDAIARVMDQDTAKSSGYQLEFKELFQFFTTKFDQLAIDKQLFCVSLYSLTSRFLQNQYQNAQPITMKDQVPLTNKKYMHALFSFFSQNQTKFWPYKELSLMSIMKIYDIFFDQCPYKIKIFLDQGKHSIEKIQTVPFLSLPQSALGRDFESVMFPTNAQGTSESFKFKGHIFRILMNSKDQTRKIYKLPTLRWKFTQSFPQTKTTLEDLIQEMSSIGFKMSEIASLIKNFSLVLNLGLVQLTQQSFLKQDKQRLYSRIVQTQAMGNISALYTGQAETIRSIMMGQTNYKGESYQSIEVTSIKKQVLMRILWEQAINRFARELNLKVQNGVKDYSKMKRFQIFCHHNASLENSKINQKVFIQDGSLQFFQYTLIGQRIADKEFNNNNLQSNNAQFDLPSKIEKTVQSKYLSHLESEYTSFNAKIIEQQRQFYQIYNQIKDHFDTRQIVKQIFFWDKVQTSSTKYFNQFFAKQDSPKRLTDNNYFICSDYWQFIHQQKEGPKVMDFFINLFKQNIKNPEPEETPHYNPATTFPKSKSIISPYSPSKSQSKPEPLFREFVMKKQEVPIKKENSFFSSLKPALKNSAQSPVKSTMKPASKTANQKPIPKIEAKPVNQPETQARIEPQPQSQIKIELKPQISSPSSKTDIKPEPTAQQKPMPKPMPKPIIETMPKPIILAMAKKQTQKTEQKFQTPSEVQEPINPTQPSPLQKQTPIKKVIPQPLKTPRNQQQSDIKSESKQTPKVPTIGDVLRQTPKQSVLKTPKRSLIRVELPTFIKNYLYGDHLIQINRFFNSFQSHEKINPFNIEQICQIMEHRLVDLHLFNSSAQNQPIPESLNQMPLGQVKHAKQIVKFVLFYDDAMQSYYIEATPDIFNKIQLQNDLQKDAVKKIVQLFRTFKWVRNDRLYFFRKHLLAEIHRKCRLINFGRFSFNIIENRYLKNLKEGFSRLKKKYALSKLDQTSNKVIESDKQQKTFEAFERLKGHQLKVIACEKIEHILEPIFRDVTANVFRGLVSSLYELIVTTPSGSKKNIDDLTIDTKNVNETTVLNPGNTSTSNVKNLLSSNQKKSFSNKVTVPFDEEKFHKNTIPSQSQILEDDQFNRSYTSSEQQSQTQSRYKNASSQHQVQNPVHTDTPVPTLQDMSKMNLPANNHLEPTGEAKKQLEKPQQNKLNSPQKVPTQEKPPVSTNLQPTYVSLQSSLPALKQQTQTSNPNTTNKPEQPKSQTPKQIPAISPKPVEQPKESKPQPIKADSQPEKQNVQANPPKAGQQQLPPPKQQIKPPLPPPPVISKTQVQPEPTKKTSQIAPPIKPEPNKVENKPVQPPAKIQPAILPVRNKPNLEPIKVETQKQPQLKKSLPQQNQSTSNLQIPKLDQLPKTQPKQQTLNPKVQTIKQPEIYQIQPQKKPEPHKIQSKGKPDSPKQEINKAPKQTESQIKKSQPQKKQTDNKVVSTNQSDQKVLEPQPLPQIKLHQNSTSPSQLKPNVKSQIKPQTKIETLQQLKPSNSAQSDIKVQVKPAPKDKYQSQPAENTDKKPEQAKKVQEAPVKNEQPSQKPAEVKQQKPKQTPFKNQILNEVISVANSGLSGSMVSLKSETTDHIKKQELFQIKDTPFFSFESWAKDVEAVFPEKDKKACPILFRKYEEEKMKANEEPVRPIEQERVIKEKIANASFVIYLKENLNLANEQPLEQVFYFQKKTLQKPLLKHYDINKHGDAFKTMFNCILKISLYKNTSQKLFQLLNTMIKPIKDAYNKQKSALKTVFDDEPLMNSSYELDYNVLRDEMFLQLAKQIMGNEDSESMVSVIFALDIVTKNYYPSNKLFYAYLNHMKTNHVNKPDMFNKIYENLLKFAQAVEGYKGTKAKIYKDEVVAMTPAEFNAYLQVRSSLFFNEQCQIKDLTIKIELYNRERFEFKIGNETLKTIKKKLLNELGFNQKQKNFALYQQKGLSNFTIMDQKQKTIDYLSKYYDSYSKHNILLRVKHYYPIRFKDINSLRMFYLNMIGEEVRMPFKQEDYQNIVAMSISFNEFQEDRISNFIVISKKEKLMDNDLISIKDKLQQMAKGDSQKKICQFEYFKIMKEFKFLLAKVYKVTKEQQYFMDDVDRIVIKPKELCMYSGTILKSSLSLFRIKSFYYENSEIHIDFIYSDRDLGDSFDKKFHGNVKNLKISNVYRIKELYEDIVYYTEMLHFGIKP